jgi:hypothetical protein
MTARRGPIMAAIWLIALGSIFLVRQALELEWGEAWPLFVIGGGAIGVVSRILRHPRGVAGLWSFTWPVLWIAIGTVLLLSTTGTLGREPIDLAADSWPWILVAVGVWFLIGAVLPIGEGALEQLVIPLGAAAEGVIRLRFGAGELTVGPADPGHLVDGRFEGGVIHHQPGPGRVELEQDLLNGGPWPDGRSAWSVGLAPDVPLDLRFETGAARARLDLSALRVRTLDLHTGASDTTIRVPRSGSSTVRADSGAAALTVEVPEGVAARIRTRMALGSTHVDETRFPHSAEGFESADFATAANRVDLDLRGGVGSIRILSVA